MEPWQSWAAAIVVGGGLFYYYTQGNNPHVNNLQGRVNKAAQPTEPIQASNAKRRQAKAKGGAQDIIKNVSERANELVTAVADTASNTVNNNATNGMNKRKAGKDTAASQTAKPVAATSEADVAEEEDIKDWAAQLVARKKGISLNKPDVASKANQRQSSKPAENRSAKSTKGSSMDSVKSMASDSASSAKANNETLPRAGGDVSDMLEARAAPPSVLRIVGEEKPKKQRAPRVEESEETKKQRQNKRKAEEQRLERDAQEKQRQVLLENQRRTAREARGEPAKNGLTQARTPATSVWTSSGSPSASGAGTPAPAPTVPIANGAQLLDTFEPDGVSTASSYDISNGTTSASASSMNEQDLPSEEAQMQMITEMSGWNEVSKGKKGKKNGSAPEGNGTPVESKSEPAAVPSTTSSNTTKPSKPGDKVQRQPTTNGYAALLEPTQKGHPDDSDWL